MKVYQTNHEGFFVSEVNADPDPLDKGNWLIPGGCVKEAPPELKQGQKAKFVFRSWVIIDPEPVVEFEPQPDLPKTHQQQEAKRQAAFVSEADPLFFQWQAGESTEEEWLAKRQEVRDRYPYPIE